MNQRLITIYEWLASSHRERFLANDVETDAMWQKPVNEIILRKENQYPTLRSTELARIKLQ